MSITASLSNRTESKAQRWFSAHSASVPSLYLRGSPVFGFNTSPIFCTVILNWPSSTCFSKSLLASRKASADLQGSYTQKLFAQGVDRIAKKVVEEAGEVVIAAKNDNREDFLGEAADLIFHLDMLLLEKGASLLDVVQVLQERHTDRTGAR